MQACRLDVIAELLMISAIKASELLQNQVTVLMMARCFLVCEHPDFLTDMGISL